MDGRKWNCAMSMRQEDDENNQDKNDDRDHGSWHKHSLYSFSPFFLIVQTNEWGPLRSF
jgi:hypothetical protein